MQIIQRLREDVAVVELSGALDYGRGDRELERVINDLAARGIVRIVIDMSGVGHIDTTCLGLLIAANLRCRRRGGGLTLVRTPLRIRQVLTIARLDLVLLTFASEDEAIRTFPTRFVADSGMRPFA